MGTKLTKSAYKAIEKELHALKTVKRKEIAGRLEEAKSFGDLSENFEYQQAKDEQGELEKKIVRLEKLRAEAEITEHTRTPYLELGSRFEAQNHNRKKITFE